MPQITAGTETGPEARMRELSRRQQELDQEIARVRQGDLQLLNDTALKDRFQQFMQLARDLLGDFHEVEHNFRALDRQIRERITLAEGPKRGLLDEFLRERDTSNHLGMGDVPGSASGAGRG